MSRFMPVFLPDERRLNGRVRQTFLRHYNGCPRSGFLYALYEGEAKTPELMRGSALHAVVERATRTALEEGEPTIPPEVVKVIVNEVLADSEFAVPLEEHDYIREMAFRWAAETAIDPQAVVAVETLFVWDVAGWQVRATVDFAELLEGGAAAHVVDYKSSKAAPSFEDVSRKRPDGSYAAKNFQLVLYALMLAFGMPVRVEECDDCSGLGMVSEEISERGSVRPFETPSLEQSSSCAACEGEGHLEFPEPLPVAGRAQRFDLEFVYPGIEDREGRMLRRPLSLSRAELDEYRLSLEALLARVARSEESGDWPAVISDSACGECPASSLCPIPVELRDHRGTINTPEEASEAAEVLDRRSAVDAAIRKEIKAFAKSRGVPVRYGADKQWEFGYQESERIADRDGMWDAIERARLYGEAFDPARFVKVVKSTPFKVRTLTAEELAAEAAEGEVGDGESADERWGVDAPY